MMAALLLSLSLSRIRLRYVLTVFGLTPSSAAICLNAIPEPNMHRTWYSRCESASCPGVFPFTEVGDEAARERRAHVGRAARDLADRLEQLPARVIFTQISCGARPQDAQGIGILPLHVQHQDTAPRVAAVHVADEPEDRRGPEEQVEQQR